MTLSAGELALVERQFVSNFAVEVLGIKVHVSGVLHDADAQVTYSVVNEASEEIRAGIATHPETGTYEFALTSAETAVPGLYLVYWDYRVDDTPQTQETYYEVGQRAPDYDALPAKAKSVVENVYWRFADLFDSPLGGPHLQVYVQTNFGRQRLAQALRAALSRLNVWSQPIMTYSFDGASGGKEFPYDQWGGVLEQALYVEVLKHLRRSYVEQPTPEGVTLARLDRRDYMDRWGTVLADEQRELDNLIEQFKIAHMGLGSPSALISGGAYGYWGPTRLIGSEVARPHYWAVWH